MNIILGTFSDLAIFDVLLTEKWWIEHSFVQLYMNAFKNKRSKMAKTWQTHRYLHKQAQLGEFLDSWYSEDVWLTRKIHLSHSESPVTNKNVDNL